MLVKSEVIKFILGSHSSVKREYLEKALSELEISVEISICQVSSGVDEQPLTKKETIEGARNRALGALESKRLADVAVGMEGGLTEKGESLYMICVAAVYTREGEKYLDVSDRRKVPDKVRRGIEQGEQFGELIREYARDHKEEGVRELVSRERSFSQALRQALRKYKKVNLNTD